MRISIDRLPAAAVLTAVLAGATACSGADARTAESNAPPATLARADQSQMEALVYKSPTCGCCSLWADHLREHGFKVVTQDVNDLTEVKATAGVPRDLFSCHTAVIDGYVIEGHVPADVIRQLLAERPKATGLAVPGMPMGSPGMEGARKDPYDVVLFDPEGKRTVYARR